MSHRLRFRLISVAWAGRTVRAVDGLSCWTDLNPHQHLINCRYTIKLAQTACVTPDWLLDSGKVLYFYVLSSKIFLFLVTFKGDQWWASHIFGFCCLHVAKLSLDLVAEKSPGASLLTNAFINASVSGPEELQPTVPRIHKLSPHFCVRASSYPASHIWLEVYLRFFGWPSRFVVFQLF